MKTNLTSILAGAVNVVGLTATPVNREIKLFFKIHSVQGVSQCMATKFFTISLARKHSQT